MVTSGDLKKNIEMIVMKVVKIEVVQKFEPPSQELSFPSILLYKYAIDNYFGFEGLLRGA